MTSIFPTDLIKSLISLQNGSWYPVFSVPVNILMTRYFTPDFIAAWTTAASYNDTFPVCDGDPITGYFGVTSLTLTGASTTATSDSACSVGTSISASLADASITNLVKTCNVVFSLLLVDGQWLIDDIDQNISSRDKNSVLTKHAPLRKYFDTVPAIAATCRTPISVDSIEKQVDPYIDGLNERMNG